MPLAVTLWKYSRVSASRMISISVLCTFVARHSTNLCFLSSTTLLVRLNLSCLLRLVGSRLRLLLDDVLLAVTGARSRPHDVPGGPVRGLLYTKREKGKENKGTKKGKEKKIKIY